MSTRMVGEMRNGRVERQLEKIVMAASGRTLRQVFHGAVGWAAAAT